ncbi:hypothetical protein FQN57_004779 [Myotisia sp. PD_48]|nr:hypothetical protein FQN57_004779 [Myotisia sp. PD_48]
MEAAKPTPARAVLASALLSSESSAPVDCQIDSGEGVDSKQWNLKEDLEDGISLVTGGKVVGISPIASHPSSTEIGSCDTKYWTSKLSLHFLIKLVSKSCRRIVSGRPNAFVIQFYDSNQLSSELLYRSIKQTFPDFSQSELENVLNSIKIFRAFEFGEMLRAVDQVSDMLFHLHQQNIEETSAENEVLPQSPVLLLVEGIDKAAQEIIRTSTATAANSQLSLLLRTFTILSRTYHSHLVVLIVNSIPQSQSQGTTVPGANPSPDTQQVRDHNSTDTHPSTPSMTVNDYSGELGLPQASAVRPLGLDMPVQSIFVSPRSTSRLYSRAPPRYISPMTRTIDQGIDMHILISAVHNNVIVEVAKDRTGDNTGRWCIYS